MMMSISRCVSQDFLSTAVTAATASTDDSELQALQAAGVELLTLTLQAYAQASDILIS